MRGGTRRRCPISRARRASRTATEIAFVWSRREVGSSTRIRRQLAASARAIATRPRSPVESRDTRWPARSERPTSESASTAPLPIAWCSAWPSSTFSLRAQERRRVPAPGRRRRSPRRAARRGPARSSSETTVAVDDDRRPAWAARARRAGGGASSFPSPDGPVTAVSVPPGNVASSPSQHVAARRSSSRRRGARRRRPGVGDGRAADRRGHSPAPPRPLRARRSRRRSSRALACVTIPARRRYSSGRRSQPPRPTTIVSPHPRGRARLRRDAPVADLSRRDRRPSRRPGRG